MICVVARQFPGPDGMIAVGTRVDVSSWRPMNVESLLRNRFITPVALSERTPVAPKVKVTVTKAKPTKRILPRDE